MRTRRCVSSNGSKLPSSEILPTVVRPTVLFPHHAGPSIATSSALFTPYAASSSCSPPASPRRPSPKASWRRWFDSCVPLLWVPLHPVVGEVGGYIRRHRCLHLLLLWGWGARWEGGGRGCSPMNCDPSPISSPVHCRRHSGRLCRPCRL